MLKNNGKWEQNLWELVSHKAEFVWGPGLRSQEGTNPCLKKTRKFGTNPSSPQARLNEIELGIGISSLPRSLLELCCTNSSKKNILEMGMTFRTTLHGSCFVSELPELFLGDGEKNRWERSRILFVEKKRRLVLNEKWGEK